MPNTKPKPVPEFQSEDEERQFWATHDSTEFIDWRLSERRTFPNRKPTLRTISLRLPVYMIEDLKVLANKRDGTLSVLAEGVPRGKTGEGAAPGVAAWANDHRVAVHTMCSNGALG